jgi:hypothetical protein
MKKFIVPLFKISNLFMNEEDQIKVSGWMVSYSYDSSYENIGNRVSGEVLKLRRRKR